MKSKTKVLQSEKGKLKIGDQWNAISILARSQTNVLKALCELVENAIDAGGRNISILRRKKTGDVYLEISDDGKGVKLNDEGKPDFKYVATHICDSMKRYLKTHEKEGVHGEFGIGLLGFWSLGRELHMFSSSHEGRVYEMIMQSGKQSYSILNSRIAMAEKGVKLVVGPLHATTKNILSGEKICKYLSIELRDRLKNLKIDLSLHDRISRKNFKVTPVEFLGERLKELNSVNTPFGNINMELYYCGKNEGNNPAVILSKDGTRVKKSICELDAFNRKPWNMELLEGVIDCPFLELTPGTRDSVIHNDKLFHFTVALGTVEISLLSLIEERQKLEQEKASEIILKDVKKAFNRALNQLPANEYIWFDVKNKNETGTAGAGTVNGQKSGNKKRSTAIPSLLDELPGEPVRIQVYPKVVSIAAGESRKFRVHAFDLENRRVDLGVSYTWQLEAGAGELRAGDSEAVFTAPEVSGNSVIKVRALAGKIEMTDSARIKINREAPTLDEKFSIGKGLPDYILVSDTVKKWRCRYVLSKNIIEVNSAHRDFILSRESQSSHKRYVAKLYAKEIVMLNFPNINQNESLERIIELLVHMERNMR